MTRINCVPTSELSRQHLLAEYRELPRVFNLARKWWYRQRDCVEELPNSYRLGEGHVKFFYTRLGYARARHQGLVQEMIGRGYDPRIDCSLAGEDLPSWMQQDWAPAEVDLALNRQRLAERS